MKKIFITGITGLLGTNLANELLEQGHQIKAIVRNPEGYVGKRNQNLELIQMDLWGNYDDYLNDAEIVVHIAAETATNLLRYSDYDKINYQATKRLFEKSLANNVSQFIFISTANTIGHGCAKHLGTESQSIKKPFNQLYYAQSKLKAEKYLLTQESNTKVKILNPTFMIGAFDNKPSSGKIILMGMNKKFIFYPPGGKNFVAVKDVVNAITKSFENGTEKEKYLIAGENLSYRDFFSKLTHITQQKSFLIPIPKLLLLALGIIGNGLRKLNIRTSLSFPNMQTLCLKNYYSNKKSISDLNMRYSSLDTAIKDSVTYFDKINQPSNKF